MIVYNESSILTSPGPIAIEITLDGIHLGGLRRRQYFEIDIAAGSHVVCVRHKELLIPKYYENTYECEIIDPGKSAMRVFTRIISTGFSLVEELPTDFHKKYRMVDSTGQSQKPTECPQVMSLTMEFDDGTSGRYLMVQTDSLDEAKAVAKEWAIKETGVCPATVCEHQGVIPAPDCAYEEFNGFRVWELPF